MLFTTYDYTIFFLVTLFLYWILPWNKARLSILLAASFFFYTMWSPKYLLVLLFQTTVDFVLARWMDRSPSTRARRFCLILMLMINLGILGYYKYTNFLLATLEGIIPQGWEAVTAWRLHRVILPLGISFYTFEGISYGIDVYRRKITARTSLFKYWNFILFFPHLVSGPIVRAADFLPQLTSPRLFVFNDLIWGAHRVLLGACKKLIIADRFGMYADRFFAHPVTNTLGTWIGIFTYAVQIYFDFSGYSDMAIGCARMLGLRLAENFNWPYLSRNIAEFWHRWHMSLSSWLRDYLYIPLGGSRNGPVRTSLNLLITMTLGGLWHGASWTFVMWGLYHGILLIIWRYAERHYPKHISHLQGGGGQMITFLLVNIGWVLFRAPSFAVSISILKRLFVPTAGLTFLDDSFPYYLGVLTLVVIGAHMTKAMLENSMHPLISDEHAPNASAWACFRAGAMAVILLCWQVTSQTNPFIYFQF